MEIYLTTEILLSSDSMSWMLKKKRLKKKGGDFVEVWEAFKWFGTAQQAVQGAADYLIRASTASTLVEALNDVDIVVAKLTQALSPRFNVKVKEVMESGDG